MNPREHSAAVDRFEARIRSRFDVAPDLPVLDWLESAVPNIPYSPKPGPFRRSFAPWIEEPMAAACDPSVALVQLIACVQASKSQLLELLTAHIVMRDPGPTLALQDKDENAADWMKTRVQELWRAMPDMVERMKQADTTKGSIVLPNMSFWALGARNPRNLQRRSIRWLLCDETWLYPQGALAEALARLTAFGPFGKAVLASQGSSVGDDTDELWKTTTMEEWAFRCTECNHPQAWDDANIVLPENARLPDGDWDFAALRTSTRYKCAACGHHYEDRNAVRARLNESGHYIRTNPTADPKRRGFRWNALAVRSWGTYAENFARAEKIYEETGDDTQRRIIRQKQMARPYEPEADEVVNAFADGKYAMADEWADEAWMTADGRFVSKDSSAAKYPLRIMTVDCQKFGFWVMVRSWNTRGESRLKAWGSPRSWRELEGFAASHGVHRSLVFADAGNADDETFIQLKARGWSALRGDQRQEYPWIVQDAAGHIKTVYRPYGPSNGRYLTSHVHKVGVTFFSVLATKDIYSRLKKRGRWTEPKDAGSEYDDQMTSERRIIKADGKPYWEQVRRNNHLFDCASMQVCVALMIRLVGAESERAEDGSTEKSEESSCA